MTVPIGVLVAVPIGLMDGIPMPCRVTAPVAGFISRSVDTCGALVLACVKAHCSVKMKLRVSELFEAYFVRHGQWVASHPYLVILFSSLLVALGGAGLVNFHWEANAIKLWIPTNSDFVKDFNYLWNNHPPEMRFHSVLFTTDSEENILQPKYIQQMYRARKAVDAIRLPDNSTWEDYCQRLPVVKISLTSFITSKRRRRKRSADEPFFEDNFDDNFRDSDPSIDLYPEPYCSVVESMDSACFESTILELWGNGGVYDEKSDESIAHLELNDILEAINGRNTSHSTLALAPIRTYILRFTKIYQDVKHRNRRQMSMSRHSATATQQARRRQEDNLAIVFMGIVLVFLICHSPRLILSMHEMMIIHDAMKCQAQGRHPFHVWTLITMPVGDQEANSKASNNCLTGSEAEKLAFNRLLGADSKKERRD
eukprot:maker-scaffold106_size358372-snap-gene-2.28 protein:Tk03543 transcript:maker-scaffold106_size358372-snap-gene-2.28-mRNA-1 annotation:"patched domain-containing protein 3-like"